MDQQRHNGPAPGSPCIQNIPQPSTSSNNEITNTYQDSENLYKSQARRRKIETNDQDDPTQLYDMENRLRGMVDLMEGERGDQSCLRLGLDNSMMSTIFGLVFLVILTVTFYAFYSLYKAISKKFFPDVI